MNYGKLVLYMLRMVVLICATLFFGAYWWYGKTAATYEKRAEVYRTLKQKKALLEKGAPAAASVEKSLAELSVLGDREPEKLLAFVTKSVSDNRMLVRRSYTATPAAPGLPGIIGGANMTIIGREGELRNFLAVVMNRFPNIEVSVLSLKPSADGLGLVMEISLLILRTEQLL